MQKLYLNPAVLAIITGIAGSGKTTLSLGLHNHGHKIKAGILDSIFATYIDKDMVSDGFTLGRRGEFYEGIVRSGTYQAIDNMLKDNLILGNSILINAPYSTEVYNEVWAERYKRITDKTNSKLKIIRCVAPADLIKERLKSRNFDRDKEKLRNWEEFIRKQPIKTNITYGGIEVDMSNDLEKNVSDVLNFLIN